MQLVKKEIEVPKELLEAGTLVVELLKDIVAKKDITAITGENLPLLMSALEGLGQMKEELESEHVYDLVAFLVADLIKVFKKKPEVVPA